MNPPEEATLLAVEGTTLVLERPLRAEHFTTIYDFPFDGYPEHEWRTDLPSYVMTLWRGIKIQGDEESQLRQFGCRTGAFFGGIYRITNTEFFRCGQAGLLGGYPTHFHMMNKRLGDVFQSYLKHNVFHGSYQRAITVHGTSYTVITDNCAYDIAGHAFFLEDGTEKYGVMDRNLIIGGRRMIFGLKSDLRSAGLWGSTEVTLFWRDNVVSDASVGYRFRGGEGAGDFINNFVAHSDLGWSKGPHFVDNFTCFRCRLCADGVGGINWRVIESGWPTYASQKRALNGWEDLEVTHRHAIFVYSMEPPDWSLPSQGIHVHEFPKATSPADCVDNERGGIITRECAPSRDNFPIGSFFFGLASLPRRLPFRELRESGYLRRWWFQNHQGPPLALREFDAAPTLRLFERSEDRRADDRGGARAPPDGRG
jgi:hypothetical protein